MLVLRFDLQKFRILVAYLYVVHSYVVDNAGWQLFMVAKAGFNLEPIYITRLVTAGLQCEPIYRYYKR